MSRFNINGKYEYCPNGNYWEDVSGIMDREFYLFCDCNKCKGQVYKLKPFNITKKIKKEQIERFRKLQKLDTLRFKVNLDNMDKVLKIIDTK